MRRVATSWKVIEGVLKENARSAYEALRPPASTTAVRELEGLLGTRLPQALVSSLCIHDGMRAGVVLVDYNSLLSVVNSTNSGKVVKVRFLEGKNSKEVLDFNLWLSPRDVWTAAIIPMGTGAGIVTADLSWA